jgi:hypothetical protein
MQLKELPGIIKATKKCYLHTCNLNSPKAWYEDDDDLNADNWWYILYCNNMWLIENHPTIVCNMVFLRHLTI